MVKQNTITIEQMESYQRIFDLFDVDSSGVIERDELGFAIAQMQPEDAMLDEAKLEDLLDEYDADGSGDLDFGEFTNIVVALGVHDTVFADPKVTKISHYGHDHLVGWLHDDGSGSVNQLGTGENVPPLRKCSRAMVLRREVEYVIYMSILLAAVVSGVQNYDADPQFEGNLWIHIFETVVLVIFVVEAALKLAAEQPIYHYFLDKWNVFDFGVLFLILLLTILSEALKGGSNMAAVRILRLLRAVRVLRTVRFFPNLAIIVETIIKSASACIYIGMFLGMFMYIFAVVGVATFGRNDPFCFGDLGRAMVTLMRVMTLDNWGTMMFYNIWGCDGWGDYESEYFMPCDRPEAWGVLAVLYFASFLVFCVYLVVNLFNGVVTTEMQDAKSHALAKRKMRSKMAVASKMKKTTSDMHAGDKPAAVPGTNGAAEYANPVVAATFEEDEGHHGKRPSIDTE
jgi:voltage-gated sodium channel